MILVDLAVPHRHAHARFFLYEDKSCFYKLNTKLVHTVSGMKTWRVENLKRMEDRVPHTLKLS